MLQRIVDAINFRVDEKAQKLTVYIDRTIPQALFGDDQRLAQVLTNLLGNAVKFTPEKGSICLNTYFLAEDNGVCTIKIAVTDTGIGISPEQQAVLFQSFQQAENDTTRKFGGTGLGLTISKNIVEMMGGEMWIESELGKGACFSFTVKMKRGVIKKRKYSEQDIDWASIKILAVDDDASILKDFKGIVEKFGGLCDTAANALEALDLIDRGGEYSIYFIDWKMPGIDGIELTRALKSKNSVDSVIIMISSTEYSEIAEEARGAGVDKFLQKPLFPSTIAEIIGEYMGQAAQHEENADINIAGLFAGRHILLAEDVEINREIVLALLEPTLIEIDSAENGKEAVRMFNAAPEKYAMIFMDVQMPEMDGYEATRAIRALEAANAKTIPIIAMTANVFKEDVEKCLAAGMNGHVGKPVDMDEVISALRNSLL